MGVVTPHRAIREVSDNRGKDPKHIIRDLAGDLEDIDIIGDMVLVGIYIRPEKTAGGIIRPDMNKEEDIWQGKVGLVLKWGKDAFRHPETGELYEQAANVGDWCVFKVGDGWQLQIRDYPCRLVRDVNIRAIVKDPIMVL